MDFSGEAHMSDFILVQYTTWVQIPNVKISFTSVSVYPHSVTWLSILGSSKTPTLLWHPALIPDEVKSWDGDFPWGEMEMLWLILVKRWAGKQEREGNWKNDVGKDQNGKVRKKIQDRDTMNTRWIKRWESGEKMNVNIWKHVTKHNTPISEFWNLRALHVALLRNT